MIITIFRNRLKAESKHLALSIREYLVRMNATVAAEDEDAQEIGAVPLSEVDPKTVDFLITLGGDGTILRAIHRHPELQAPILGVNLGGLGFMADIPMTDIYPSLNDLLNKRYKIEERLMMDGQDHSGNTCRALNEISFHRAKNPTLIELAIHVDGTYLNTFSADGVILATPCGSTAYSMAAGGPILTPDLDAFIITPICPHTISNRPIVLLPKDEIQIQLISGTHKTGGENDPVEVSADGLKSFHMFSGEVFCVKRSKQKARLVKLHHHDYFSTLREKLGWAVQLKNKS